MIARELGSPSEAPAVDELLARADRLAGVLRERSAEAERRRSCPEETIADLVANGLLRICQPSRFGGYELGWDVLCAVSQRLARGCGSQAWVQNIFSDHAQKIGTFPAQAQDDVWGADREARISASFDPVGKGARTKGGARFSGRHGFASGIDHASWLICGGQLAGDKDGSPPERCFFLIPKSDARVIDDWFVVGLCGTGSKSFEVDGVFVPDHRILRWSEAERGAGPGSSVNAAPVFRIPRGGITSTGFAAVGVGIAQGFLREYLAYTKPRKSRGTAVAELAGTQIGVGAASAEIAAAALVYIEPAREAMRLLAEGKEVGEELKLRAKRDSGFAVQLVLATVTRLYASAGGRALASSNVLQRQLRDLLGVASHHSLVWDSVAGDYGAYALQGAADEP
jgi:alkylation response protein AidB-like acyl-CoA dehydrogenase